MLGRCLTRRRRLGLIRAAARPRAALQAPGWRTTSGARQCHCNAAPGRAAARIKPRRPRWPVLRPSGARRAPQAQSARRVHDLARETCLSRSDCRARQSRRRVVSRGAARPAGAGNPVAGAAATATDAVAIAQQPGRARRCREGVACTNGSRVEPGMTEPWIPAFAGTTAGDDDRGDAIAASAADTAKTPRPE